MEGVVAGMATMGGLKLSVRLLKSEAMMAEKKELEMFLLRQRNVGRGRWIGPARRLSAGGWRLGVARHPVIRELSSTFTSDPSRDCIVLTSSRFVIAHNAFAVASKDASRLVIYSTSPAMSASTSTTVSQNVVLPDKCKSTVAHSLTSCCTLYSVSHMAIRFDVSWSQAL
jgi:hypothetical protein